MIPIPKFSRTLVAALLAATFATTAPAKVPESAIPTYNHVENGGVSSYTLANGLKVILVPYPSAGEARVSLVVRSGSNVEGYGETGMAHLLEHMVYMGAGKRRSVKDDLNKLNASWNGTTSPDRTNYFATITADQAKLEELLRITADMFIDPRFTEDDLKREMTVVRNEMELGENSAEKIATQALMRQMFAWHGYGRPTIGARSDVERAPFSALKDFHRRNYRPDNAFLVVSGVFDPKPTVDLINSLFARAKNPQLPKPATWTREAQRPLNSRSEIYFPTGSTAFMSAWKLPPAVNRETTAFQLGATAICSQEWGVVRKPMVIDKKLATRAACTTRSMIDATLFVATASGDKNADPEAMRQEMLAIIESAAAAGITQQQLDRARLEQNNMAEAIATNMTALAAAMEINELSDDWRRFFVDRDIVQEVTLEEVNAALRKWVTKLGRSDVLIRHQDKAELPPLPEKEPTAPLAEGKSWPRVISDVSPKPTSWEEYKAAVKFIALGEGANAAKGALVQRKTNGDRIWLHLTNRYGNAEYLAKNGPACNTASALFAFGGAGLDRNALDAIMEALDARWSFGTGGVSISVKRKNLAAALDVLIPVWLDPALPEEEFERNKKRVLSSIDASKASPSAVADKKVDARFDNFPEGHPHKFKTTEQLRAEREAMEYGHVKSCARDLRGLSDYILVVTGDMSQAEFVKLWEERFKNLPRSKIPYERVRAPIAPDTIDTSDILVTMPNKPAASITAQGLLPMSHLHPDFVALRIAFEALGDGSNGRLFKRLREKEGLSYDADAALIANTDDPRSAWFINASASSKDYKKAMAALKDEVATVLRDGFTEEEIERAKTSWLERRKGGFSKEGGYASAVAGMMNNGMTFDFIIGYDRNLANLPASKVSEIFRKYVSMDKMVWAAGVGSE